jgi:hypothetical protein
VALKIHHRFVALLRVGDHAVVDRADLDATGDRILHVDGDGLGLTRRQVTTYLGTERGLELNKVAGHTDGQVPHFAADTEVTAGDLCVAEGGDLLDSGQSIHFGLKLHRRPLRGRLRALQLVIRFEHGDVAQHIGGDLLAHTPEAATGAGCGSLLLQQLQIQILTRLIRGPGQERNARDKTALVGDDLVEPGGQSVEEKVSFGIGDHLAQAEIGQLIGVDLGGRQWSRGARDPPGQQPGQRLAQIIGCNRNRRQRQQSDEQESHLTGVRHTPPLQLEIPQADYSFLAEMLSKGPLFVVVLACSLLIGVHPATRATIDRTPAAFRQPAVASRVEPVVATSSTINTRLPASRDLPRARKAPATFPSRWRRSQRV